ncbi:hypothetical protein OHV16_25980 [Streptomyces sp. NBC_00470]
MTRDDVRRSKRQEQRLSEKFPGGKRNPGSGNGWIYKNDIRSDQYSIEAKTTQARQFTLKLADLLTAERHALQSGRDMLFALEMGNRNWLIMAEELFLEPSSADSSSDSPSASPTRTGPPPETGPAKPSAATTDPAPETPRANSKTPGSTTPSPPPTSATDAGTTLCAQCGKPVSPSP